MITLIGNIEVASPIDCHARRVIKVRQGGVSTIAAKSGCTIPRHGADGAIGGHFANSMIIRIGNIEVASPVDCHALRVIKVRQGGVSAIAAKTR